MGQYCFAFKPMHCFSPLNPCIYEFISYCFTPRLVRSIISMPFLRIDSVFFLSCGNRFGRRSDRFTFIDNFCILPNYGLHLLRRKPNKKFKKKKKILKKKKKKKKKK